MNNDDVQKGEWIDIQFHEDFSLFMEESGCKKFEGSFQGAGKYLKVIYPFNDTCSIMTAEEVIEHSLAFIEDESGYIKMLVKALVVLAKNQKDRYID